MPPEQSEVGDEAQSDEAGGRCQICLFDSSGSKEAHLNFIERSATHWDEQARRARERNIIFHEAQPDKTVQELARRAFRDAFIAASRAQDLHDHYMDIVRAN